MHHRDEATPPEDIAEVMEDLVQAGKTRYWGVSNHSAAEVEAFLDLAPIAGVEDYYNIAGSHCDEAGRSRVEIYEEEMLPLLRRTGLGCLAFSPMDTGLLARPNDPALAALVAAIDQVAADLGTSRAAVCVAWVLHQGHYLRTRRCRKCRARRCQSPGHPPPAPLRRPRHAINQARQTYRASQQEQRT